VQGKEELKNFVYSDVRSAPAKEMGLQKHTEKQGLVLNRSSSCDESAGLVRDGSAWQRWLRRAAQRVSLSSAPDEEDAHSCSL